MATQTVILAAAPNRALTARLYSLAMVLENTALTTTEVVANTGVYRASFIEPTAYSGSYRVVVIDDLTGFGVATYEAVLTGTDGEEIQATEFVNASGGDASDAKQDQILAAITPITTVYSPQVTSETLTLIVGDAYDGVANSKLSWTVSQNIDAATAFNFTIRDKDDAIVLDQDTAGVTTAGSGTTVEVSLSSAATLLLDSAESDYQFDYEVVFSADSRWTITRGVVCVEGHQSR